MSEQTISLEAMRRAMVASQLRTDGVADVRLLEVMGTVPRESFVPEARRAVAYADLPVPLGGGRAINPPITTARLFDAAEIMPGDRVLVIGAAMGYAVAIAERLAASVVALETDPSFVVAIRAALPGATVVEGVLEAGAADHAPYDAIIIDGAVELIPDALVDQLAPGGRIAAAIMVRGVASLAIGRRGRSGFAMTSFAESDAVVLPGFAHSKVFTF